MEDISPKADVVEDVDVESVKTLEIADDDNNNNPEPESTETKRDISILEDIIDKAEKILDGDEEGSSSSSSSSSDDEKEAVVECEPENEDKLESSLVENLGIDAIPPVVEDPVSTVETENEGGDESKEALSSSPIIDIVDQKSDEVEGNIGEESKVAVDEPPIEDLDSSHQIITPNIPSDEPAVTKDSSEATSWNSCCGLFEFLRRSER